MKRKHGWSRIGAGLVLSVLFLIALPACEPLVKVAVNAQCAPSAAFSEDDSPPTGTNCGIVGGRCRPPVMGSCYCTLTGKYLP
jgi:hypothetical protein